MTISPPAAVPLRRWQQVHGVVFLDKPAGITSNAALQRVRRAFGAAKAGHVGTLDPLATGLLPVCLGEATKFSSGAFGADKTYDAVITLGITTTTGDAEGEVVSRLPVTASAEEVKAVLGSFVGVVEQVPPMHSALKRGGTPLYVYARRGEKLDLPARSVRIHGIRLLAFEGVSVTCQIACGSGTYIRVLAEDIGRALGCGASLSALRRIALGRFSIDAAVALDRLEAASEHERAAMLRPIDALLGELPALALRDGDAGRIAMGRDCTLPGASASGPVRLYTESGRFIGIGEALAGGRLVARRLVASPAPAAKT